MWSRVLEGGGVVLGSFERDAKVRMLAERGNV